MDVVYTCRTGDNEELRYSIRSVVKNLEGIDNVWVVGGKPDWYSGNFINVDPIGDAFSNVRNSLKTVIDTADISENFILMNDDFFVIDKINSVPNYYSGSLHDRYLRHQDLAGPNYYANYLMKTSTFLKQGGIEVPLNYELHVPMILNKAMLSYALAAPFSIRSYYGNMYNIGGEDIKDVKIYSHPRFKSSSSSMDNGTAFVSTDDLSFEQMGSVIKDMFPEPSQYEK